MNEFNINLRQQQLQDLKKYVNDTDKDITLILQCLQWDRKQLQQGNQMVTCKYDSNHRIPADNVKEHEEKCYLKSQDYITGELLFPEPLDADAATVVKLSSEDIINYAVKTNPSFKRSSELGVSGHAPLTLGHLQSTYSTDERRALYDAVAAAAPPPIAYDQPYRDLTAEAAATSVGVECRGDALLALRDARRRRARHRRAARDGYKHELRELITTQMELFTGKWTDENTDIKPEITSDEIDDGRRCEEESDRHYHVRDDSRSNYINPNRRESRDDKRRDYKRESRDHKERDYENDSRGDKRGEKERESRGDRKIEYERERKKDKSREYERERREEKKRKYDNEYDRKCKERNKIYEREVRKHQQYDREYIEIKQDDNQANKDRRKREERCYDYKDRKKERNRSSTRDNKKYHRREERGYHKQVD